MTAITAGGRMSLHQAEECSCTMLSLLSVYVFSSRIYHQVPEIEYSRHSVHKHWTTQEQGVMLGMQAQILPCWSCPGGGGGYIG